MPDLLSGILIAAPPGRMLSSLRVLLRSCFPQLPIEQLGDEPSALILPTFGQPRLVLIDADLPGEEGWRLGVEVRDCWPRHHALILAHDLRQTERAHATGLDVLPLDWLTADQLLAVVQHFWKD
jgi:hypothetical protein